MTVILWYGGLLAGSVAAAQKETVVSAFKAMNQLSSYCCLPVIQHLYIDSHSMRFCREACL